MSVYEEALELQNEVYFARCGVMAKTLNGLAAFLFNPHVEDADVVENDEVGHTPFDEEWFSPYYVSIEQFDLTPTRRKIGKFNVELWRCEKIDDSGNVDLIDDNVPFGDVVELIIGSIIKEYIDGHLEIAGLSDD